MRLMERGDLMQVREPDVAMQCLQQVGDILIVECAREVGGKLLGPYGLHLLRER